MLAMLDSTAPLTSPATHGAAPTLWMLSPALRRTPSPAALSRRPRSPPLPPLLLRASPRIRTGLSRTLRLCLAVAARLSLPRRASRVVATAHLPRSVPRLPARARFSRVLDKWSLPRALLHSLRPVSLPSSKLQMASSLGTSEWCCAHIGSRGRFCLYET